MQRRTFLKTIGAGVCLPAALYKWLEAKPEEVNVFNDDYYPGVDYYSKDTFDSWFNKSPSLTVDNPGQYMVNGQVMVYSTGHGEYSVSINNEKRISQPVYIYNNSRCKKCNYNLRASKRRCPECAETMDPQSFNFTHLLELTKNDSISVVGPDRCDILLIVYRIA